MSVTKNEKTGKWDVRVQYHGKRQRYGAYKTKTEALAAEASVIKQLEALDKVTINNLPSRYEPKLEQTDQSLVRKMINRFKKAKAERAKDKETRQKLENM